MKVTFNDFCERVKKDTEKTVSLKEQYNAVAEFINSLEFPEDIYVPEYFTDFQFGALEGFIERKCGIAGLKILFKGFAGRDRQAVTHGLNYTRKVLKSRHEIIEDIPESWPKDLL